MVLAQYTIRSKQDYIFKTNRVLEIIGASENIAKAWDKLFEQARKAGVKCQRVNENFHLSSVKEQFENKKLQMAELFCGGGNETVLFDNINSYKMVNCMFSYHLLEQYPGMVPMAVYVEAQGDYSSDYKALMEKAEKKKNTMLPAEDIFTVPFAMMDRETFQPYSKYIEMDGRKIRMSEESYGKNEVGRKLRNKNRDIRIFDEMITRKGKESLLAVVHADGNNMGTKIMDLLKNEADYDKAVPLMREFTAVTADCFEKYGLEALNNCREELWKNPDCRNGHFPFGRLLAAVMI